MNESEEAEEEIKTDGFEKELCEIAGGMDFVGSLD